MLSLEICRMSSLHAVKIRKLLIIGCCQKGEVKISAVEWAISALLAVEPVDKKERKEQESAKLKEFLKSPFRDEL